MSKTQNHKGEFSSSGHVDEYVSSGVSPGKAKEKNPTAPLVLLLESPRLLLTAHEAARYLRVSRRTLSSLTDGRMLTFTRIRGSLRFRLSDLNSFLDRRTIRAVV